jgi:hypothetical protein
MATSNKYLRIFVAIVLLSSAYSAHGDLALWLSNVDSMVTQLAQRMTSAEWDFYTNATDENVQAMVRTF